MIAIGKFEKEDFDQLIGWVIDEEMLIQFAGPVFTFPLTTEQLEVYVKDVSRQVFKVVHSETNQVIGHAEIAPSKEENTLKICRIFIGKQQNRSKGYGKQIIRLLLEKAFYELSMKKAELNVYDWNIGAIKCYESMGFVVTPNKSMKSIVKGKEWKAINMHVLKERWKEMQ